MRDDLRNALDLELHRLKLTGPSRPQILTGLSTGFRDLDEATGGFHAGDLVVLAGTRRVGTTALALNVAENHSINHDHAVAFVAPDEDPRRLARRLLAGLGKMELANFAADAPRRRKAVRKASEKLEKAPLWLDTTLDTMPQVRGWIERLNRGRDDKDRVRLVVLDNATRVAPGEASLGAELKRLAADFRCTVLACMRTERDRARYQPAAPPTLDDAGATGYLVDHADTVLLLHREELSYPPTDRPGEADVIIAKHAESEGRVEVLAFMERYPRFANLAREGRHGYCCSCGS